MTAPPRPELLTGGMLDEYLESLASDAYPRLCELLVQWRAYTLHLERELESCQAALDDLRGEPEPMWGPDL